MNREGDWGAVGGIPEDNEQPRQVTRKVAVLGHSQIRDLPLLAGASQSWGDNRVILTRKFFVPGATVESIQTGGVWERFLNFSPDLTFIWIGGNDISATSSPLVIGRGIVALARRIKEISGGEVKIITIERRPAPRGISQVRYNRQRSSINRYLKHRDQFARGRLVFLGVRDDDSQDGVHLRHRTSEGIANTLEWEIRDFAQRNW